ncbi:MAG: pyridoxal 5'-phosphate synthase glutaminase subunit PdxT [Thermoplasmata archaeon]
MRVGVLALQGDVPEHTRAVERLVHEPVRPVRMPSDLTGLDALLLPGGESTTISDLMDDAGLRAPLRTAIDEGLAVLATCAGLIVLSRRLEPSAGGRDPRPIELLDVRVRRNDFGRQRESFEAELRVEGLTGGPFPGVFIRSPRILEVGPDARPIAWRAEEVVGVRAGRVWGLTFHPELAADPRLHRLFLDSVSRAGRAP